MYHPRVVSRVRIWFFKFFKTNQNFISNSIINNNNIICEQHRNEEIENELLSSLIPQKKKIIQF